MGTCRRLVSPALQVCAPSYPFDPPDGCCQTPFSLGGEAANFGRVLRAFDFAGPLAPGQGFLVRSGFSIPHWPGRSLL